MGDDQICKKLEVDAYEVADGMGLDNRIGRAFLESGIGWGALVFQRTFMRFLPRLRRSKKNQKFLIRTEENNRFNKNYNYL